MRAHRATAALIAALAMTPSLASAEDGYGTFPSENTRLKSGYGGTGLIIAGATTWAGTYAASVTIAVAADGQGTNIGAVPLVGPFIAIPSVHNHGIAMAGLALAGVAQVASATMLTVGIAAYDWEVDVLGGDTSLNVNVNVTPRGLQFEGTF